MILASNTVLAENQSHRFGGGDLSFFIECNQKNSSCKQHVKLHQLANLQIGMTKIYLTSSW